MTFCTQSNPFYRDFSQNITTLLSKPPTVALVVVSFVHLVLLWSWMVCSQLIRWLVVFVCNALTWYSSPPPFNLFGAEPTLNAQIASFHRDSSVSRAVLLRWAPEQTPGSLSPMPWKGGWTCGSGAVKWPGTHQPLEVFCLKLFHSFTLLCECAFNIKQARTDV